MKKLSYLLLLPLSGLAALYMLGPKEPVDETVRFDGTQIGNDLDNYLIQKEAKYTDILPGAQKEIIWADSSKSKTEYSIVYLHGFSATKEEIRPVPDLVAKELNANLFYTRLRGHGREGKAMAEASANDWINDTAEAVEIGRRMGEKVVVISTSTGSTIATWAATQANIAKDVVGIVQVSPNYGLQAAGSSLLTFPWARKFVPALAGDERSWEPLNEGNRTWWTTRYPTVAVLPMASMIDAVNEIDFSQISIPSLFIYSEKDKVVVPKATKRVADLWGADALSVLMDSIEEPGNHVIMGDIMSPSNTQKATKTMLAWIREL